MARRARYLFPPPAIYPPQVSAPRELSRALAPLKEVAAGVERGVRNELDTVERRLAASGAEVDEAQRQGMEKRVQVRYLVITLSRGKAWRSGSRCVT